MNNDPPFANIFKKASTTYYYSSIFFPKKVRDDVFTLYAFVRTADNLVDAVPQYRKEFTQFYKQTRQLLDTSGIPKNAQIQGLDPGLCRDDNQPIITSFIRLAHRKHFEKKWIVSFLDAMKADLTKKSYNTYRELEQYMYGSAEVIGLMMARIMNLPDKSHPYAQAQGKAMQLINFIRDVKEDEGLGRNYLAYSTPARELRRYFTIQKKAEEGYTLIPKRYLIPIKTASDMYFWTAKRIEHDPSLPQRTKVKPKPLRVFLRLVYNALTL